MTGSDGLYHTTFHRQFMQYAYTFFFYLRIVFFFCFSLSILTVEPFFSLIYSYNSYILTILLFT